MSTFYIGINLGTTTTCIYKSGNGIVLREASLIAIPTNLKIKDVKAIGNEAKRLIGRVPENISIYSPISNGVIQYEELAVLMLKGFLKKIFPTKSFGQNIKAIVSVPLGLSPEEKKRFEIVCYKAGIADVYLVPNILCFAVGSGINIQGDSANLIVDIGGDITDIATVSNSTILNGYTLSIGGSIINVAIAKYIEETYNIKIGIEQAEHIKHEICSLFENYAASMEITGINKETKLKEKFELHSAEIFPIIDHYYGKIADAISALIQSSDPEVISDISQNGICFYGGASSIIGFEKYMSDRLTFKINLSESLSANVLGTGELIRYPQLLKKIIKNN